MKTVRIGQKDIYIKDIIIAVLIAILPFLFYLYKLAPETQTWDLGVFSISSNNFTNIYVFLWIINVRLFMSLILCIWFITCQHWWKHCILIPLIIELFKFFTIFNVSLSEIDENEIFQTLPLTLPIIILLIFLSKKLNYYVNSLELNYKINDEINFLLNDISSFKNIDKIKNEFLRLKKGKRNLSNEKYLVYLLKIRNRLTTYDDSKNYDE